MDLPQVTMPQYSDDEADIKKPEAEDVRKAHRHLGIPIEESSHRFIKTAYDYLVSSFMSAIQTEFSSLFYFIGPFISSRQSVCNRSEKG